MQWESGRKERNGVYKDEVCRSEQLEMILPWSLMRKCTIIKYKISRIGNAEMEMCPDDYIYI